VRDRVLVAGAGMLLQAIASAWVVRANMHYKPSLALTRWWVTWRQLGRCRVVWHHFSLLWMIGLALPLCMGMSYESVKLELDDHGPTWMTIRPALSAPLWLFAIWTCID
jgi:hypothetical protein